MRLTPILGVAAAFTAILVGASFLYPASVSPASMRAVAGFSPIGTTLPPDEVRVWMAAIETSEMRGDFAELDRLAVTLRNVDVRFAGGEPKIAAFYAALGDFAGCGCASARESFVTYESKAAALKAWMAALPHSPTVPVAMARLLRQRAWQLRGHAFANETDDARLAQFADITRQSVAYLQPLDPKSDPAIYAGILSAARASDTGRDDMDRIFPAAISTFPTYYPYYASEAEMLQDRWFGAPGEAARFLASLPDLGDTGLVAYADAVDRLDAGNASSSLPKLFKIDWTILRRAFDTRRRLYGTTDDIRNEELKLAVVFSDRATARRLLDQIGTRWAPHVWQRWTSFQAAADWVHADTGMPPAFD
jgi:hypothetical protein